MKMKRILIALLLLVGMLSISSCKPDDECRCTRVVNGETKYEIRPLESFSSCQELADDMSDKLDREVDCF
jgi:hypothetical protein